MRGECAYPYRGKRGNVWRVRWRDASGQLVTETRGRETGGWTRRRANEVLRERQTDVRRQGLLRPRALTVEVFAVQWLAGLHDHRDHRNSTRLSYRSVFENHLLPFFGDMNLPDVKSHHIDSHVAKKRRSHPPLSPSTLNLHLTRLNSLFDAARRLGHVAINPVKDAERPEVPKARWTVLMPSEVSAVLRSLEDMASEATGDLERRWRELAQVVTLTMLYAWLRRGERGSMCVRRSSTEGSASRRPTRAREASRSQSRSRTRSGSTGTARTTRRTTIWCSATRSRVLPTTPLATAA